MTEKLHPYFEQSDEEKALGLFQVLGPDGLLVDDWLPPDINQNLARKLYAGMRRIRIVDARMLALQRQGRTSFYGEAKGQEATAVGSAAATKPDDWVVPALREAGVGLYRGLSLNQYVAQIFGNAEDCTKGRQMPCHPCGRDVNYVVMSSCVSSQIPHAVGIAMGMKLSGDKDRMAIGYMGDGGTSEGDFHVAINFAGVYHAPVVLFCQNNQWAISTPGDVQSAGETIALKAIGYGVEPIRVDGNDVLACYEATRYAAEKARRGDGPTFIEALTYRVGAHTSSDDPSRYRDESITEVWKTKRDPLQRMRTWLISKEWMTEEHDQMLGEAIETETRNAIEEQEKVPKPEIHTLVEDVFEEVPWHLAEQREALHQ